MSDEYTHTGLPLVGKHIPDYSMEKDADGNSIKVELPGKYHIGTIIDGVFVPLVERKAAGLFKDIERVRAAQPKVVSEPQEQ